MDIAWKVNILFCILKHNHCCFFHMQFLKKFPTGRVLNLYFRNISFKTGILIICHKESKDNTQEMMTAEIEKFKNSG